MTASAFGISFELSGALLPESSGGAQAILTIIRRGNVTGAAAELHLFQHADHGFGISPPTGTVRAWPALYVDWLRNKTNRLLPRQDKGASVNRTYQYCNKCNSVR